MKDLVPYLVTAATGLGGFLAHDWIDQRDKLTSTRLETLSADVRDVHAAQLHLVTISQELAVKVARLEAQSATNAQRLDAQSDRLTKISDALLPIQPTR